MATKRKENSREYLHFDIMYGGCDIPDLGRIGETTNCDFCGKEYRHHNVVISFEARRFDVRRALKQGVLWGEIHTADGGYICSKCFSPDPKKLSKVCRQRAAVLRVTPPPPDLEGDDRLLNIRWAASMRRLARLLDNVDDFSSIDGGIPASGITEFYRVMDRLQGKRTRRAA